jgi:SAM-dependent methyltransferase
MSNDQFSKFADAFEAINDWPKRLANEAPFYRWLFERASAKSVIDVACGTGHHVNMFRSWGLCAAGADASPTMIERCRARWGEGPELSWSLRAYDQPIDSGAPFDVAICIGNSLALAPDPRTVATAVAQMLAGVCKGGAIFVQVLNFWAIPEGPCLWQKCIRANLPAGERLIIKGVHRSGQRGFVEMLVTNLATNPPELKSEQAVFQMLDVEMLESAARRGGCSSVEFFGGYDRKAYEAQTSQDLMMVAWK